MILLYKLYQKSVKTWPRGHVLIDFYMLFSCKNCMKIHVYFYPGDWKVKNLFTVRPSKINLFQNLSYSISWFGILADF